MTVRSFLKNFRDMEVHRAKAFLRSIVKAAHVFKDGRIEVELGVEGLVQTDNVHRSESGGWHGSAKEFH